MSNPHRGQVALQAGEETFTLSFSVNALCELEDLLDETVNQIAERMNDATKVRMSVLRAMLWAALRDHHEDVDIKRAGEIATAAGIMTAMEKVGEAFQAAFPPIEEAKAGAEKGPRKEKAGAG